MLNLLCGNSHQCGVLGKTRIGKNKETPWVRDCRSERTAQWKETTSWGVTDPAGPQRGRNTRSITEVRTVTKLNNIQVHIYHSITEVSHRTVTKQINIQVHICYSITEVSHRIVTKQCTSSHLSLQKDLILNTQLLWCYVYNKKVWVTTGVQWCLEHESEVSSAPIHYKTVALHII